MPYVLPLEMMDLPGRRDGARAHREALDAHRREALALLRSQRREARMRRWHLLRRMLGCGIGAWWRGWLPGRVLDRGPDRPPGPRPGVARAPAGPIPLTLPRAAPRDGGESRVAPRRAA